MKYFEIGIAEERYCSEGITLHNIFSLTKTENGIRIMEDCDRYHFRKFTKEETIELFEEAIAWVKKSSFSPENSKTINETEYPGHIDGKIIDKGSVFLDDSE